ncbi:hypothetical protein LMF57_10010 [Stenotrophomonas sp. SI-NJAU-1]|uniref:hypothetical protein n=1 Tax=Stenotrophomonas sp. SI-NJAU-1 TaxID=2886359 RepID=UPI001E3E7F85|nr:hypothetical protein [Stenotrophomonas sp. SI-NJAU-1]UEX20134.1 hypothetical protein LMF57_10010 [Stenotrophomonas sp. SI-NJAU-1]
MTESLFALALLAAIAAGSVGGAKIISWLLDRRDCAAIQRAKEAAFVAQASAAVPAGVDRSAIPAGNDSSTVALERSAHALIQVGQRPMSTFPESVQNHYGGQ